MKIYHQTGHNYKWNIDSLKDGVWDGLIFSPINMDSAKLSNDIDATIKSHSFLDPQIYTLNVAKGFLETYPFFPWNLKYDISTEDLDRYSTDLAELCADFQFKNDFEYLVIPTKHNNENPSSFLSESAEYFVNPFCDYVKAKWYDKKVLLSVIIKESMLLDIEKRDEILNWLTWRNWIHGVYIMFENSYTTKQIKDFNYLSSALNFISILKRNWLEVHIGYCNTEAILYSLAMPDSVSIGSYENLRSFGIKRFQESEATKMRSPNARLYSNRLLQWISYGYIQSIKNLVPEYESFFEDSEFSPLNFTPEIDWQFKQTEPYKHYFKIFSLYCKWLPVEQMERINIVKEHIKEAIASFKEIEWYDVLLDENSDWSHLPIWHNVVAAFQKNLISC